MAIPELNPQSVFPDTHRAPAASIEINEQPLDFDLLDKLFERRIDVTLSDFALQALARSQAAVQRITTGDEAVYGVNTGFGSLCTKRIPKEELAHLQENLIVSHAVGVGDETPCEFVRLMMLLKIKALCHGYSGVRVETVRLLADMLNADLLPVVPSQGSLGASGDLAPLAHMVLPMLGLGQVRSNGQTVSALEGLTSHHLKPTRLGPKEGLALINGTQFMAAHAVGLIVRAMHLVKHVDVVATMSLEGLRGSVRPFAEKLHALRPHPGAKAAASNVRRLTADSEIQTSHAHCGRVQDPYSLRCVPQVHGAARDALDHVRSVVEIEINSVTDNPVVFEDDSTISGGLFHGEPLAFVLDYLAIALAELASISERRIYLLLSGQDDLPALLMRETGINSGFMLPQYTAAALVSENKVLCHPATVDSIPTSLGQEDHVSMGATAAVKAWKVLGHAETVLAIEQMCAAQAIDFRAPLKSSPGIHTAHETIRKVIPHAQEDRLFGEDIKQSLALLRSREILHNVEAVTGTLL